MALGTVNNSTVSFLLEFTLTPYCSSGNFFPGQFQHNTSTSAELALSVSHPPFPSDLGHLMIESAKSIEGGLH